MSTLPLSILEGEQLEGEHEGEQYVMARPAPGALENHRDNGLFKVQTLSDALTKDASAPPWVIQDLLLRDSATLVSAHPHSMKSLSLLCACMEAAAKKPVWNHFPADSVRKTLFIETEDPAWMVESRIRGLAKGLDVGTDLPGFFYCCTGPFDLIETQEPLIEALQLHKPDFAVLSTLQGLLGGRDWLRQDQMADVNALVVELSRHCCPLVVVTHSPWDKKQRRAAGTITQAANFATSMHLQKKIDKSGTIVHVTIDSKAGASETDFSLKLNTAGDGKDPSAVRSLTFEGRGWPKGSCKDAVMEALEEDMEGSSKEIAELIGCSERYVQKIRKEMLKDE